MSSLVDPRRTAASGPRVPSRVQLWAEFAALYLAAPLALALVLPPDMLWPIMGGCLVASLILLWRTPGFEWSELLRGPLLPRPGVAAGFVAVTVAAALGMTLWLRPGALFILPRAMPELWLTIMVFYPFLSALPQELAYRVLFFRRYGALFPSRRLAVAVNAGVFGLAHLFLWNWVAPGLTAVGGAVFAWAYLEGRGRNFLSPWLLHALAGCLIFTSGLGMFFYHGAIR